MTGEASANTETLPLTVPVNENSIACIGEETKESSRSISSLHAVGSADPSMSDTGTCIIYVNDSNNNNVGNSPGTTSTVPTCHESCRESDGRLPPNTEEHVQVPTLPPPPSVAPVPPQTAGVTETNPETLVATTAAGAVITSAPVYHAPISASAAVALSPANGGAGTENKWSKNGYGQSIPRAPLNGKFSPEESELVRNAIESYCASKNITAARLCSECNHLSELKGAWMEIARALPHRTVQSVYRHGLRQLHPFKRGAWSEEECDLLFDLVQLHGKKWSLIQGKLNRSADSCRDKYREMPKEYVKGRWKLEEAGRLVGFVREYLKLPPLDMPGNAMPCSSANTKRPMKGEDGEATMISHDVCDDTTIPNIDRNDGGVDGNANTCSSISMKKDSSATGSSLTWASTARATYLAAEIKRINEHCDANGVTIPWSVISKRMADRSRLSCFKKWQKMKASGVAVGPEDEEDETNGQLVTAEASHATERATSSTSRRNRGSGGGRKRRGLQQQAAAAVATALSLDPTVTALAASTAEIEATGTAPDESLTRETTKGSVPTDSACALGETSAVSSIALPQNKRVRTAEHSTTRLPNPISDTVAAVALTKREEPFPTTSKETTTATAVASGSITTSASISYLRVISDDPETLTLLRELSQTDAHRHTDIDWAGLSHPRAFARWSEVLDMVEREDDDDEVLDLDALSSQAKMLLRRCTRASGVVRGRSGVKKVKADRILV